LVKFGATEQEEKKRRRLRRRSVRGESWERQQLTQPARGSPPPLPPGLARSLPPSPALPSPATPRSIHPSSPFPRRLHSRSVLLPANFFFLNIYFFPFRFFFFFFFFLLFGADPPKTSTQLTAALAASSPRGSFAHRRGDATSVLTPFGRNLGDSTIFFPPILGFSFFF
ncbi:hypothetical protein Anapl_02274, partial [Anas platyrhynchos]